MKKILIVTGRELKSYFISPIAYVILGSFTLIIGWFYFNLVARFIQLTKIYELFRRPDILMRMNLNDMVIQPLFYNMTVILIIITPIMTMRLLAEEKNMHTDELILTSPISTWEIVLGKFFGAFIFFLVMVLFTGIFMIELFTYSNPKPEFGPVISAYLGIILMGSAFLSVGIFTSSITSNQLVAAVTSFLILLMFYVINIVSTSVSSKALGDVLNYVSLIKQFDDFTKGVIDIRNVVYYLSFITIGLFFSKLSLDSLRWR